MRSEVRVSRTVNYVTVKSVAAEPNRAHRHRSSASDFMPGSFDHLHQLEVRLRLLEAPGGRGCVGARTEGGAAGREVTA